MDNCTDENDDSSNTTIYTIASLSIHCKSHWFRVRMNEWRNHFLQTYIHVAFFSLLELPKAIVISVTCGHIKSKPNRMLDWTTDRTLIISKHLPFFKMKIRKNARVEVISGFWCFSSNWTASIQCLEPLKCDNFHKAESISNLSIALLLPLKYNGASYNFNGQIISAMGLIFDFEV